MNLIKKLWQNKWIKGLFILGAFVLLFFIGLYFSIYLGAFGKVPTTQDLSTIIQEESTEVLDKDGVLIGKYYIYDRQPLEFEDFPKHLIDALVATEDVRFFQHDGIDNVSLLRVFVKSILLQDKSSGGGSTVTLQLAKNLFGRKHYKFVGIVVNKFKESIIAKRLEEIYTKEEILTLYFNTVPFSDNTYGIESASQKFFNKTTKDLTISESAILVGSLKANTYYNPRLNLERSQKRRDVVLYQMEKYGYLPTDSLEVIKQEDVVLHYRSFNHDMGVAPYFREQVKKELTAILDTITSPEGEPYDLYKDGLIVHTTLDFKMQQLAEEAMKAHMTKLQKAFENSYGDSGPWTNDKLIDAEIKKLTKYKQYKDQGLSDAQIHDSLAIKRDVELFSWEGDTVRNINVRDSISQYLKLLNTGMLSVDPSTGAVRAYIGGIDYRVFKFDHVTQSERQVGSTFKPIVYTAAIQNGMKPCEYFSLAKVTYTNYDSWTPSNSGSSENDTYENYSLEKALSHSVNTIAVKVLNKVGIPKVLEQAKKMGISKKLPAEPSIALGVAQVNLKELTAAYTSFVNCSRPVKPYYITKIEDRNGNIIASFKPEVSEDEAFSDYTRQVMLEYMKATVDEGTAKRIRSRYGLKNAIAGKTGTTQDNKDGWFVGITPNLVTVTWVGNDNYGIGFKSTGMGQGANSALPIFAEFYQKMNADTTFNAITKAKFERPSQQVESDLNCEAEKRDSFLKRLFTRKHKKKKFRGD
ncbi:transglycosylase domain-containing protein [Tamlana agarivorans]|uniref:Transglycosylase domain-containing protein n=1 Tax=Pseudotamlana agarivorans TaxID=481183 RepID=A0ACC5U8M5_9FLAO|nr:transglycosylase domain-containing protein [Tamlana agarivorans]MBU2950645.1 transglycosylase domain-containing protein [Tamlana agarivorans]